MDRCDAERARHEEKTRRYVRRIDEAVAFARVVEKAIIGAQRHIERLTLMQALNGVKLMIAPTGVGAAGYGGIYWPLVAAE